MSNFTHNASGYVKYYPPSCASGYARYISLHVRAGLSSLPGGVLTSFSSVRRSSISPKILSTIRVSSGLTGGSTISTRSCSRVLAPVSVEDESSTDRLRRREEAMNSGGTLNASWSSPAGPAGPWKYHKYQPAIVKTFIIFINKYITKVKNIYHFYEQIYY